MPFPRLAAPSRGSASAGHASPGATAPPTRRHPTDGHPAQVVRKDKGLAFNWSTAPADKRHAARAAMLEPYTPWADPSLSFQANEALLLTPMVRSSSTPPLLD